MLSSDKKEIYNSNELLLSYNSEKDNDL